jgi:hypothetical protein
MLTSYILYAYGVIMRGAIPAKISSAYELIHLLAIKHLNHGYYVTKIQRDMFPTWT